MSSISLSGVFGMSNALIPRGGPKIVGARLDFSNVTEILIDGEQLIAQGQMEYLQGFFVDNSANIDSIVFSMSTTGQRIVVPANSQGYFTILVPNTPKIIAETPQVNLRVINCLFYNVPIQSQVWKTI